MAVITGTAFKDTLGGGSGNDSIYGLEGDDSILGNEGDDYLDGGSGNDVLRGNAGNDTLLGGSGNDSLRGDAGDDRLDGGDGLDAASYRFDEVMSLSAGVRFDLSNFLVGANGAQTLSDGLGGTDTLISIERFLVVGSVLNDTLIGSTGDDSVVGNEGDDSLNGGDGNDTILGDSGDDAILGKGGNDLIYGGAGNDGRVGGKNAFLSGGAGADTIYGEDGDDQLFGFEDNSGVGGAGDLADILDGGSGNDLLRGNAGNDTLLGGPGNDNLRGDEGDDRLDGGDGSDLVSYRFDENASVVAGVRFDVSAFVIGVSGAQTLADGFGGTDTLISIERFLLSGTALSDTLTSSTGDDTINGNGGNDYLDGGDGNDTLLGDPGDDTILGRDGNDAIDGGEGNDSIVGGSGRDTLIGGSGDDYLDGGAGFDTVPFNAKASDYRLLFKDGTVRVQDRTGAEGLDTLVSIEQLQFADKSVLVESRQHGGFADLPTTMYQFFILAFGAAPGVEYLQQCADAYRSGASVKVITNVFASKSQFTDIYPTSLSNQDMATKLVTNVVGASATQTVRDEAIRDIAGALDNGLSRGDMIFTVFSNLAGLKDDAKWGGTAQLFFNQIAVAKYYTETMNQSTTDRATLAAAISAVTANSDVSTDAAVVTLIGQGLIGG